MRGTISITEKDFDKAVEEVAEAILVSGDISTDRIITAMLFSFAVFDQLYSNYGKSDAFYSNYVTLDKVKKDGKDKKRNE